MPNVNPRILKWARETAGLSLAEAARKLDLRSARGETGELRLERFEMGEREPSKALLQKMAKQYRRSLLVFYLEAPPSRGDRGQDFRTLPDAKSSDLSPNLDVLVRNVRSRQRLVKSILEDDEGEPLAFVGSASLNDDPSEVARSIARTIDFDLSDFRGRRTLDEAFAYLRRQVEATGVFVLLAGNLGSHHTKIPADAFRGYAIADKIAPLILINDQDARIAWAFTALHELAHVWLGETGVSGDFASTQVEVFCNRVAGSVLLPAEDVATLEGLRTKPIDSVMGLLSEFANARKLSRKMVADRLLLSGLITQSEWNQISGRLREEWERRETTEEKVQSGGPSYYSVKRHRLGPALRSLVQRGLAEGSLTYTKAAHILDVKPLNVRQLLDDTPTKRAA